MKAIKIIILLIIPIFAQAQGINKSSRKRCSKLKKLSAQNYFVSTYEDGLNVSLGIDTRNALIGGTVNDRALDYVYSVYIRDNNIEFGYAGEYFPLLDYLSSGVFIAHVTDLGYNNKWEVVPRFKFGSIKRGSDYYNMESVSMDIRYKVKRFKFFYSVEYTHRGDLDRFVINGYGGVIYNLVQF